ncbi:MAG TPA: hypothetical protein VFW28_14330 [Micropepsaceae bacterium]|nr:hypothetical protein [Micropepsaceae bacterium]
MIFWLSVAYRAFGTGGLDYTCPALAAADKRRDESMSPGESKLHAELCRHQAEAATALADVTERKEFKEKLLQLAMEWLRLADEIDPAIR